MTEKPFHQRLIIYIGYVILGLIAFGTLLDALANSLSIVTFQVGIWASVLVISFWLSIEIWIKKKKPIWITQSNTSVRINKLGLKIRLALIGGLILLWLPITKNYFEKVEEIDKLTKIQYGQSKDYLNSIFGVPEKKWQDSIYSFQKNLTEDGFLISIFDADELCGYFISCTKPHPFRSMGFEFTFNKSSVQEALINDRQSYELVPSGRGSLTGKPLLMYSNSICRTAHRTCNPNNSRPYCTVFISNECNLEVSDFFKTESKISSLLCCNSYELTDYILERYILIYSEQFVE